MNHANHIMTHMIRNMANHASHMIRNNGEFENHMISNIVNYANHITCMVRMVNLANHAIQIFT